jgi:putative transposase
VNVYPCIEAERAQQRNITRACELLEVSGAAYYAHRAAVPSARQLADEERIERIRRAHQASKGRYGAPRIHAQLGRQGHRHGRKRVARLMRAAGLHGRTPAASSAPRSPIRQRPRARTWSAATFP